MRAKLIGFMGEPGEIARRYPLCDVSLPARYARVIADYRFGRLDDSLRRRDGLIAAQPGNAYFWELKGQMLLEGGQADAAIAPLRKAAAMAPQRTPIRVLLGHALVAPENVAITDEAIRVLARRRSATRTRPRASSISPWPTSARATAKAQLAAAQALFVAGKYVEARTQAKRAQEQFKEGTPGWLKADDILNYRPPGTE